MKIAILDAFTADQGDASVWKGLEALGSVTRFERSTPSEVIARGKGCEVLLTNKALVQAEQIAALPDLRYVGVMATGTNVVDLKACAARGIAVTNVPGYSTESVAQLVFALILHLCQDVAGHHARSVGDGWASSPDFCFFTRPLRELAGKHLVIVGAGSIGRAVARIAEAFAMRVTYAKVPGSSSPDRVDLADCLPQADVISLHCPLTDATRHLVNAAFLGRCKRGALLVNTGRGPLIDEAALGAALASGQLGGAGLDVLAQEPPPRGHALLKADAPWASRLVVTPHIAWGTVEARTRLIAEVVANLAAFQRGEARNRVG